MTYLNAVYTYTLLILFAKLVPKEIKAIHEIAVLNDHHIYRNYSTNQYLLFIFWFVKLLC